MKHFTYAYASVRSRLTLMTMAVAVALLASCDDENLFRTSGDMTALAFRVVSDKVGSGVAQGASRSATQVLDAFELDGDTVYLVCTVTDMDEEDICRATRGTPITTGNLATTYGCFNVSAYVDGDLTAPLLQTDGEGNALASPAAYVDVSYVFDKTYDGAQLWKTTATDFYWPKDQTVPLTFYAYAPTSDYTGTDAWAGLTPADNFKAGGVIEFDYTVPANKTNSSSKRVDAEYQPDILVASIPSIKRTDSSITNVGRNPDDFCIVPMTFYHALSAIDFKVSAGLKRDITLNSLTLSGLKAEGTCTYTPPTTSGKHSADVISWTDLAGTGSYCQTYDYEVPATAPATDPALGSASQTFMLIPQAIGPSGDAPAAKVTITYNDTQTKTVALKPVTWLPGKRYTYLLTGDLEGDVDLELTGTAPTVNVKNTGKAKAFLRVAIVGNWCMTFSGTPYPVSECPSADIAFTSFHDGADDTITGAGGHWVLNTSDGYWYYSKPVDPGVEVPLFASYAASTSATHPDGTTLQLTVVGQAVAAGSETDWAGAATVSM